MLSPGAIGKTDYIGEEEFARGLGWFVVVILDGKMDSQVSVGSSSKGTLEVIIDANVVFFAINIWTCSRWVAFGGMDEK